MIQLRHIGHHFGDAHTGTTALVDVSFEVLECEVVAIAGPSGCGKSTLLKLIGGLLHASQGTVVWRDTGSVCRDSGDRFGFVFQKPALLPWLTVERNIRLPETLGGRRLSLNVADLIGRVGLTGFEHRYPGELSGGMQQRVALARSLISSPAVLLLDEPFNALDDITRDQMHELLQDLLGVTRTTSILVTHNLAEAAYLADTVHVMSPRPGSIVSSYTVPFSRPRVPSLRSSPQFVELVETIRSSLIVNLT